jgi:hypothetical protein
MTDTLAQISFNFRYLADAQLVDSDQEEVSKRLHEIAKVIKAEAGVVRHQVLDKPFSAGGFRWSGWSFPKRGVIHAPAGRTDRELYTLAHECAHVALRHEPQEAALAPRI